MNTENPISTPNNSIPCFHQRLLAVAATTLLLPTLRAVPNLVFAFMLQEAAVVPLIFCVIALALSVSLYRLHRLAIFPTCILVAYSTITRFSSLRGVNSGNAAYYYVATETIINVTVIGLLLYVWFTTKPNVRNA